MGDLDTIKAPRQPVQWWRWPVMPFAAVIGATIGAYLFTVLQWIGMKFQGGFSSDGWMYIYGLPLLSSAAFGYLYTWIACTVAPKAKFISGVVMVTVLGVLSLALVLFSWFMSTYTVGKAILETLRCLTWTLMALYALSEFKREGE